MKQLLAIVAALGIATTASARDYIQIAGSSTVLPYASIVAEAFGENFGYKSPVVESGGSSAGLKRFCEGIGVNTIDIANASRAMRDGEREECAENGVKEITEVRIGYDGIVFANSINDEVFAFEPEHIYRAINSESTLTSWNEVDESFPDYEITMFIPGTKHGTREVFEEKVLLEGCKETGDYDRFLSELGDKKAATNKCMDVRTDGVSVDIDGDYTETLANISVTENGIGVFGLSFYQNNTDKLNVATMNGIVPSVDTISSGEYPVSRPLFFYVKDAHLDMVPGLRDYINFFVSDQIAGEYGPLSAYGLVPDPELAETQKNLSSK